MSDRNIYNFGYKFAKDQNDKKNRILKIVTIAFPILILLTMFAGFINASNLFKPKNESVNKAFNNNDSNNVSDPEYEAKEKAFTDAKIPYLDPNNRFSINFATPYISGSVTVIIFSDKDYNLAKTEADKVIAEARKKVEITSVNYIKSSEL